MAGIGSETTSHQKLRSRIEYLRRHLEISDASLRITSQILGKHPNQKDWITTALPIDCNRYTHLKHPVTENDRVIAHSRSKLSEFAVIANYTHFAEYLHGILGEMYEYHPLVVVDKAGGKHHLNFPQIVKHGDFHKLSEYMVTEVFRSLENERSTKRLLEKILNGTEIKIASAIRDDALYYLQMRHIFIHRSGLADEEFVSLYADRIPIAIGGKLPTDFSNANAAISATSKLCKAIDQGLIKEGFAKPWST